MSINIHLKQHLTSLFHAALKAVQPENIIPKTIALTNHSLTCGSHNISLDHFTHIHLLGAGKASAFMALAMETLLGKHLSSGLVVTKYDHGVDLHTTEILEAGHPVPDQAGLAAAQKLLSYAKQCTAKDLVFFLLSGGASGLTPAPIPPVTLEDKQQVTSLLLHIGATIDEVNCIRKHLSLFKGGHFAAALAPATVITLIISDVIGDRLDVIGSGPTCPDSTTFHDCNAILQKYDLHTRMPATVIEHMQSGIQGRIPETLKPGDPVFSNVHHSILASNIDAQQAGQNKALSLGLEPIILDKLLQENVRKEAKTLADTIQWYADNKEPNAKPICLIGGGETTVRVTGHGKGGRNQELALSLMQELESFSIRDRVGILCAGTDGTDGPTDAAGGFVLPSTWKQIKENNISIAPYIEDNNSFSFFEQTDDLFVTGPTGTNVMDLVFVIIA